MQTQTVLIVEDEPAVRKLISRALRTNGYRILEAASGPDALSAAGQHPGPIHLLLTDVRMPGMDGCELARRLVLSRPATKVLLMTGHTTEALPPGADVLQKPFTPRALVNRVQRALEGRANPRPGGGSARRP